MFKSFIFNLLFLLIPATIFAQTTDLIGAARAGDVAVIREHLQSKADVNAADQRGFTPLIIAVYGGHHEAVEVLLEAGANVNQQDASGNTALMGTAFKGYSALAELLISKGPM
ncbi:ankyrin repeat domain-containing protein [Pontibacter sp. BAB1700]|uniref:ankyrin repeat domain-containing protein n=1 Tax=Pontibacter sp. BAB1700 TaxID=1144253 RepID=UPI0003198547